MINNTYPSEKDNSTKPQEIWHPNAIYIPSPPPTHPPTVQIGLLKRRDKYNKKFIKAKNDDVKSEYEKLYKDLRNRIVQLCRKGKKIYFLNYFSNNANNIKNTWRGINQIINVNCKRYNSPSSLIIYYRK